MTGVTGDLNATPSKWHGNPDRPVEKVSWDDAQVFLTRLNAQQSTNIPAGWAYVLPTESQWEYACRAGTTTAYSWGNDIDATRANYYGSGVRQTRDVGNYAANPWGFFDMHGNIFEWTADWYHRDAYKTGSTKNPQGPTEGQWKTIRGGSFSNLPSYSTCTHREPASPSDVRLTLGFRCAYSSR